MHGLPLPARAHEAASPPIHVGRGAFIGVCLAATAVLAGLNRAKVHT